MSSSENVEIWLEKGAEAFANMRTDEADQDFESAVDLDPGSAKAHLCLGVIKFFKYLNGISMQPDVPQGHLDALKNWKPGSPPPPLPKILPLDPAKRSVRIAEQNSTNGASSEEHLKRALELEPHSEPAMEYLAALYFGWLDPADHAPARRDEARQLYTQIAQTNPAHCFADYMLGVVEYEKARAIIRSGTGFRRLVVGENRRRALSTQTGPLLAASARRFLRSLEIDPNSRNAMTYLMFVRRCEVEVAESEEEVSRARAESDALQQTVYKMLEASAESRRQSWPPGDKATITFRRVRNPSAQGKRPIPSFPPDARLMTVRPAPPPPPRPPKLTS